MKTATASAGCSSLMSKRSRILALHLCVIAPRGTMTRRGSRCRVSGVTCCVSRTARTMRTQRRRLQALRDEEDRLVRVEQTDGVTLALEALRLDIETAK